MSNERGRHQLYEELKVVMSQESADELMGYLPPVGWADVATKSDLAMIRHEMDALRAEMRSEMHQAFAAQMRWMVATIFIALTFGMALASVLN